MCSWLLSFLSLLNCFTFSSCIFKMFRFTSSLKLSIILITCFLHYFFNNSLIFCICSYMRFALSLKKLFEPLVLANLLIIFLFSFSYASNSSFSFSLFIRTNRNTQFLSLIFFLPIIFNFSP